MPTQPSLRHRSFDKREMDWKNIDWPVVVGIVLMHLGCLLAPFYFTWTGLVGFLVLTYITAAVGITLCFHRLLTHRSFKTPKWFEYVITTCGCLAWQGGPVQWVGVHRIHHKHSDEENDPHTPKHGFTWSHMLWCMHKESEGRRGVDAAKDLLRDPGLRLLNKWFWVPQFALIIALYFIGEYVGSLGVSASGISWVVWAVFLRTVLVYHGTWFVNSASHTWGYRNFETKDHSTNLWWVAVLAFGEGWHNNHHAHQRSAAHGLRWFEFDATYLMIRGLSLVGLAHDIVLPKDLGLSGIGKEGGTTEAGCVEPISAAS
jgi:fatty-acid desaturase